MAVRGREKELKASQDELESGNVVDIMKNIVHLQNDAEREDVKPTSKAKTSQKWSKLIDEVTRVD